MSLRICSAAALLALLGFLGCSSSGSGSNPTPSGPIALEDLPDAWAEALCGNISACCSQAGIAYDGTKCRTFVKELTANVTDLVNQGKVKYDANLAGTCVAEVPAYAQSCLETDPDTTCEGVFTGTVPEGGACTTSHECVAPVGGDADCDNGKCTVQPRGKAGDTCGDTCTTKGSTTYCSGSGGNGADCFTNDGLYCATASTKCESRIALGGKGCDFTESCVEGAFCDAQTCTARKAIGANCIMHDECVATAYCDQTCQTKKPLGAPCSNDFADEECADGNCDAGKCTKEGSVLSFFCNGT